MVPARSGTAESGRAWKKSRISANHSNGRGMPHDLRPILTIHSLVGSRKQPFRTGSLLNASGGELSGMIAFKWGGASDAANHCVCPTYETPAMPTLPSHHGCAAIHSTVS